MKKITEVSQQLSSILKKLGDKASQILLKQIIPKKGISHIVDVNETFHGEIITMGYVYECGCSTRVWVSHEGKKIASKVAD